ncbi:hypothetical protein HYH02_009040 [Chlamydomonas schloesseri]|uniref:SGNH hydrolase-type esterase domain-containing protein n=1 Tax=Chlamydomonas schloesseri TaxID=2026947 RepID=A0A836B0X0_9CHLO|nr:hypothetical protein HYH02_009040 [Chlamydomonas schloesseri]|eukprot:KAG2444098.1 hypothetical protein HYH02_009040 [Chlamydomonas schloesseri]
MHILAFGDSLTEGYYNHGTQFHPYAIKLHQLLKSNGLSVKVDERGHSGELVTASMVRRLPALLRESEARGVKYSWVIILGGINDLGWRKEPAEVWAGLRQMYEAVGRHGAQVLALTCMETAFELGDEKRVELNNLIRKAPEEFKHVKLLDLEKALPIPRDSQADPAAAAEWDDGLHLTPAGYDHMAAIIYAALEPQLGPEARE